MEGKKYSKVLMWSIRVGGLEVVMWGWVVYYKIYEMIESENEMLSPGFVVILSFCELIDFAFFACVLLFSPWQSNLIHSFAGNNRLDFYLEHAIP